MATDTSKSLFNQALQEILATNYVAAELLLQQASEINEEGTTLYAASWAVLLAVRDRVDEAIEILEERLEHFSTDPNLLAAYGIALEKQGNYDDAEDAFRESLDNDPENLGALRGLATCLEKKGDLVGGCRLAAKAFALAPDNLVLAKSAAALLERAGQKNTAHEVLELGAHYNPEDEELVIKALQSCLRRGEFDRAWEILLLVDETQPWAAAWKANFLDWRGEPDRADIIIDRILEKLNSDDREFLFHLCCILVRRGEIATADAYLNHLLSLDSSHSGALRMQADFAIGQFNYNPSIDPLMLAVSASSDTPGWPRFWAQISGGEMEAAEETLAALSEDEDLLSDPVEVARLELAELLFLALNHGDGSDELNTSLDELADEAACGLLLEFLEVLDGQFASSENLAQLRKNLNRELGSRDPVLRLTRLYALEQWDTLKEALAEFENASLETEEDEESTDALILRVYTLLHGLGTETDGAADDLDLSDLVFIHSVFDVLSQKQERNLTEQRFLDKLRGEIERVTVREVPLPERGDDSAHPLEVGGVLDHRDMEIVIYETEDGEIIEDYDDQEYELVGEAELDPEDENYEYVWVEEEIVEFEPAEIVDTLEDAEAFEEPAPDT